MPDDNLTNIQQPMDVTTPQIPLATVFGDEEGDEVGSGMGMGGGVSGESGMAGGVAGGGSLPPLPTELTPAVSTPAVGAGGEGGGTAIGEGAGEGMGGGAKEGMEEGAASNNTLPPLPSLDNLDAMIGGGEAASDGGGGVGAGVGGPIVEPLPMPTSPTLPTETSEEIPMAAPAPTTSNDEGGAAPLPTTLPTELPNSSEITANNETAAGESPELTSASAIETVETPAPEALPAVSPLPMTGQAETISSSDSLPAMPEAPLSAEMPVPVVPTPEMTAETAAIPMSAVAEDMPLPSALPALDNIEIPTAEEGTAVGGVEEGSIETELPTNLPSELPAVLPTTEEANGEVSSSAELPTAAPALEAIAKTDSSQTAIGENNPPSLSSLGSINDLGSGTDEAEADDGTPSLNEMLDQADQVGEEAQVPALNNQPAMTPQATKIITPAAGLMADIDVENLSKLSPVEIIDQQLAKVEDELGTLKAKASKLQQVNEELKKEIEQKQYSAQVIEYSLNSSMSRMNELEQQKQDLNAARAQVSGGGGQG